MFELQIVATNETEGSYAKAWNEAIMIQLKVIYLSIVKKTTKILLTWPRFEPETTRIYIV
jgi:hypothetical protein